MLKIMIRRDIQPFLKASLIHCKKVLISNGKRADIFFLKNKKYLFKTLNVMIDILYLVHFLCFVSSSIITINIDL